MKAEVDDDNPGIYLIGKLLNIEVLYTLQAAHCNVTLMLYSLLLNKIKHFLNLIFICTQDRIKYFWSAT